MFSKTKITKAWLSSLIYWYVLCSSTDSEPGIHEANLFSCLDVHLMKIHGFKVALKHKSWCRA